MGGRECKLQWFWRNISINLYFLRKSQQELNLRLIKFELFGLVFSVSGVELQKKQGFTTTGKFRANAMNYYWVPNTKDLKHEITFFSKKISWRDPAQAAQPWMATKGTTSNPSFEQQLEEGSTRKGKGREKGKQAKRKGEAFHPPPPAYKGKREHAQLPREQWCTICWKSWKKGRKTQACLWNSNQQHQQQHHQQQAWYTPSEPRTSPTEASRQRCQPQLYNIDQQTTYTSVLPDSQPMLSFEHQSQVSTQPAYSSPVFIAQLDSFETASNVQPRLREY